MWLYVTVLLITLTLSAVFSISELVYTSVNLLRLEKESKNGNHKAQKALHIAENFDNNIATILLGNGLVNIVASSMATLIGLAVFKNISSPVYGSIISAVTIFFVLVTFGEIIPKTIGRRYAYPLSLILYPFVNFFRIIFTPIVFLTTKLVSLLSPLWTKKMEREPVTDDELVEMVDTIEKEGIIDEKQGDLLRSAIIFADTDAFEIMTPRVDIFAFDIEDDIHQLLDAHDTFTYSRIPVYEKTIDNIIGTLPTKYLYPYLINKQPFNVKDLLVKPLFVPHGVSIASILETFKKTHQHIAIVIDEYGGTEGIVTMEDIIEEIVGEIWDETDEVSEPIKHINDNRFIVDGMMNIEDFFDFFDMKDDEESDYATVGGWCQEQLSRFGRVGDQFSYLGLKIKVIEADSFTIEKIEVIKTSEFNNEAK